MGNYGSNRIKQAGIIREHDIIEKVIAYLRLCKYKVVAEKSSRDIDMHSKIDYYLLFDESTPFLKSLKVPVDVKSGNSYTVINQKGENSLENSKSRFIIINTVKKPDELLWVSVNKLRECMKIYPPKLYESNDNDSYYMWLDGYVDEHKEFFGNSVKRVCVNLNK